MTALIEDAKEIDVSEFGTLNTSASPQRLPVGHSPNNQNTWVDEKPGSIITANGYIKLGELPSGNPCTFLLNFFKTSDGSSSVICSDGESIWSTTDYVNYTNVKSGLSPFFQLRGKVIRDKAWLTNGSDPVMTWDGSTLSELDGSGTTPDVPKGKYIDYHDERVWMYGIDGNLSSLRFSALTDSGGAEITPDDEDAWPEDNEIQISEGDADVGTGIFLYRGYLYCSKQYSMWRIVGYDEDTYSRVKTRSTTGTRFQESIQLKDNLVQFIGVDGLYVFDGEESKRISDVVDPASSEVGVFAFRNLQQPLLNNQFINVSDTADFNGGTIPANLSSSGDKLTLVPVDDSQANFQAGTLDDISATETPGSIQLDYDETGVSTLNIATIGTGSLEVSDGVVIGAPSSINDGSVASPCGFKPNLNPSMAWEVTFSEDNPVSGVTIQNYYFEGVTSPTVSGKLQYYDGSSWNDVSGGTVTLPTPSLETFTPLYIGGSSGSRYRVQETDLSINFSLLRCRGIRLFLQIFGSGANTAFTIRELEIWRSAFEVDGKFISRSLDYGAVPPIFGSLAADAVVQAGTTLTYFTQSSDDGSSWDAEVSVTNGGAIGSTIRRYIRWGAYFTSDGLRTPTISSVYLGSTYISEVFNTGGNIFQWGAFQSSFNKAGQTITYYFRAASSEVGVTSESWTAIVPGAIPNTATSNTFIQIRIFLSTTSASSVPFVDSFTINWILSNGTGVNTLQNVASFVWLNRYWLAAATLGATSNDIVIVNGKSTAGSPWQKKDFAFLSFCRFQDYFIAGSSTDGSIYRLETGYSKNGSAIDSYYETKDFSVSGFCIKIYEVLVTTDRLGPYVLSVGISTDGGLNYSEKTIDLTRQSGASLSFDKRLNFNIMCESFRLRFRINAADQPFSVDSAKVYYRLTAQRGSIN